MRWYKSLFVHLTLPSVLAFVSAAIIRLRMSLRVVRIVAHLALGLGSLLLRWLDAGHHLILGNEMFDLSEMS